MTIIFNLLSVLAVIAAGAPPADDSVLIADAAFWRAFNQCDAATMGKLLADDVEFYHDKTGLTQGKKAVVRSLMKGPCGTPGLNVRREIVAASVTVDPVPGHGAIVSGVHSFYAKQGDAAEQLDGHARFSIVWRKMGARWEMRRVLSYAHCPAA